MSQAKPLTAIERRDRYAAQNGVQRLTPAQKRRIASKLGTARAEPRPVRTVTEAPESYRDAIASGMATNVGGNAPLSGRKRFYANYMRTRYAIAKRAARRQGRKFGRYTSPRG